MPRCPGSRSPQGFLESKLSALAPWDPGSRLCHLEGRGIPVLALFLLKIKEFKPLATVEDPSPLLTQPLHAYSPAPHGASGCGNAEPQSGCGSPAMGNEGTEFREGCEQRLETPPRPQQSLFVRG